MKDCKTHYAAMYDVRMGLAGCPFCEIARLTDRVKRLEFSLSDEISLSSAVIKERNTLLERVKELEDDLAKLMGIRLWDYRNED